MSRDAENGGSAKKPPSRSRSWTRSPSPRRSQEGRGKARDVSSPNDPTPGIRIKGQAEAERQRNKIESEVCHLVRRVLISCADLRCAICYHRMLMSLRILILKFSGGEKVSSRRRLCATKSFAHGRGR